MCLTLVTKIRAAECMSLSTIAEGQQMRSQCIQSTITLQQATTSSLSIQSLTAGQQSGGNPFNLGIRRIMTAIGTPKTVCMHER